MIKNISFQDIVKGARDLGVECVKNKKTPHQQMEYSNGCYAADMDSLLFKTDNKLFWECRKQRANIDKNLPPLSQEYINGYNHKAREYGIPEHHVA